MYSYLSVFASNEPNSAYLSHSFFDSSRASGSGVFLPSSSCDFYPPFDFWLSDYLHELLSMAGCSCPFYELYLELLT